MFKLQIERDKMGTSLARETVEVLFSVSLTKGVVHKIYNYDYTSDNDSDNNDGDGDGGIDDGDYNDDYDDDLIG